jgi:hypothetical protein
MGQRSNKIKKMQNRTMQNRATQSKKSEQSGVYDSSDATNIRKLGICAADLATSIIAVHLQVCASI